MFTPTQTQAPQTTQAKTLQASTPNSPSETATSVDTTQTGNTEITIKPSTQPPPPSAEQNALTRYLRDREIAAEEVQSRYPNVEMSEDFFTRATDFLTYIKYRGTEYYKIFNLCKAFSEEVIEAKEAELLNFIREDGFHVFINEASYREKLDAKVKRVYKDVVIPERVPTVHEQRLVKVHEEEMVVKEEEIASLQSVITRKTEELEKKAVEVKNLRADFDKTKSELEGQLEEKKKLVEEEVKRVGELKQSLEAERRRLKDVNSKLVVVEEEKKNISRHLEKKRKVIEEKDEELIKLGSELTRAKTQLDTLGKETEILKLKRA